ncbi:Leucyl aminopeptidase (leukotriene A4 hydrolase) with epoxide hydrolase activity [Komagataella phaffii GS115]|uniref:Leukotriene A(4) hydrolase n=2 Tax=Komagataella phaffii TaxID=460519 RepID=C4R0U3_KOMPG|nr:Leucyl aminopeptidase (leukotriene A4 hydrolase) with epoxide hydrolase activity [Komagataella phaffii GS115]AOA62009.1 GQ67_00532T0 [Komagataella phaffii]AOA68028.1 GQ68_00856T0 [Komagataella phaffii GS115]CAY69117.1 Leucyl aminopeptidase (leukotriene A4 hydrolase) with epoxide hydrolase activity [Komagataella phaffii GS115]
MRSFFVLTYRLSRRTFISAPGNCNQRLFMSSLSHISPKLRDIIGSRLPKVFPEVDASTNSNYRHFEVKATDLYLDVNFEKSTVTGEVKYQLHVKDDAESIILDTSFLNVKQVTIDNKEVEFEIEPRKEPLGSPLVIKQAVKKAQQLLLTSKFETTDKCTALQWCDPEQTDGGDHPYLYSQGEPIHIRSLFPCFDTPSIKSPFTFRVKSPLYTLLSGKTYKQEGDVYYAKQPIPIPVYLVSIASGNLVGADVGPRSKVYAEPIAIDACQKELKDDIEDFIQTAEGLVFKYEWAKYDLLVLIKSMPFGGMENCEISHINPTCITGDKQNIDVIAHELAHSWSGNLVTNCSWDHFWLNEGWTVYLERRIVGVLHGEPSRHFSAIIGWSDLEYSIKSMGQTAQRYSTLIQDLKDGSDPDDAFSTVPYEKGFNLLFHLEQVLGGTSVFDPFIPYYFSKYKYKSLDSYQFLDTLYEFFSDKHEILDKVDWETWLYKFGLPPKPKFDTSLVDECYDLAAKWVDVTKKDSKDLLKKTFSSDDISNFTGNQTNVFLDTLVSYQGVEGFLWNSKEGEQALTFMRESYSVYDDSKNAEVIFRWYRLQLTGRSKQYYQRLADWLGTIGRMKFVRPSYRMLNDVDPQLAKDTFLKFEPIYHPICRSMIRKDLHL